jgi:hypothetical protein
MILDVIGRSATFQEPRKVSVAIVLATIVTLAAVVPLGVVAWQSRGDDGPASSEGLLFSDAGSTAALSGAVLRPGTSASLQIDGDDIVAAAWALYDVEGELLASGKSVGAPPYELDWPGGTVGSLETGLYDLLVSATEPDGDVVERAARFAIDATD